MARWINSVLKNCFSVASELDATTQLVVFLHKHSKPTELFLLQAQLNFHIEVHKEAKFLFIK